MIRHIVMFKFFDEAEGHTKAENLETVKQAFEAMPAVIPAIKSLYVALNAPDADCRNFDIVLVTEHDDLDALNEYQNHPEHRKVSEFVGKVRELRACVDFDI